MSTKAERLRVAKELAKKDGCEWGALDGPGKHSYCHAADVVISPKPQTASKEQHGHQHEIPAEEKKEEEADDKSSSGDDLRSPSGDNLDNPTTGSEDTSKPKKPRKSKAGKKARKNSK